jgi:predicted transcriptional regulator of viral defense system
MRMPSWDRLFEQAARQEGYFTTEQARALGYSSQLLYKHEHAGRITRARRGIHRLVHFPAGDHEELVVLWLWSDSAGVLSHQTALALHGLSDVLPARVHLTLPASWQARRLRVPDEVVVHHANVADGDRTWFGAVPATSARRTLSDCARDGLSPELLRQAAEEALARGLVTRSELGPVEEALAPFGGLAA